MATPLGTSPAHLDLEAWAKDKELVYRRRDKLKRKKSRERYEIQSGRFFGLQGNHPGAAKRIACWLEGEYRPAGYDRAKRRLALAFGDDGKGGLGTGPRRG